MPRTTKPDKRSVHDIASPSEEQLLAGMNAMPERYGSYAAFCYLFGNRVSEGLGIRNSEHVADYRYYKERKYRDLNGVIQTEKKPYYIPKLKYLEGYSHEPLAPWRIQFPDDSTIIVEIRVYKRSGRPLWTKIVDPMGPGEMPFAIILARYVSKHRQEYYLWDYSRQSAYRQFMKHLKIPPHKLREMRATKQAVTYGMSARDLQEMNGWVDPKMPLYYEGKSKQDIRLKLLSKREENKQ